MREFWDVVTPQGTEEEALLLEDRGDRRAERRPSRRHSHGPKRDATGDVELSASKSRGSRSRVRLLWGVSSERQSAGDKEAVQAGKDGGKPRSLGSRMGNW